MTAAGCFESVHYSVQGKGKQTLAAGIAWTGSKARVTVNIVEWESSNCKHSGTWE